MSDKPMPPLPEMETLTAEQEALVTEFITTVFLPMTERGEVVEQLVALDDVDRRIIAYKFLIARKWEVAGAKAMFEATNKMKKLNRFDQEPVFPAAYFIRGWDDEKLMAFYKQSKPRAKNDYDRIVIHTSPFYQVTYHKWDKWGHPLFIEKTGKIGVKKLVETFRRLAKCGQPYTQPCIDVHLHFNEVGGALVRYNDKTLGPELGRRVLGVVVIMDCDGLGYATLYKPALELLKAAWHQDSSYYPEGLHRLFLVNCPTMVTFAYSVVKGWLDPRVQKKIEFLKPHETKERLLQWVDAANLPEFLGGTCTCPGLDGGCVYTPAEAEVTDNSQDPLAERIVVPAGQTTTKTLEGETGDVFSYEFVVDEYNVVFSAVFTAADGNEIEIFSASKASNGSDKFTCPSKGVVHFCWSNAHSWMRGKTVTLRVMKMNDDAPPETPQTPVPPPFSPAGAAAAAAA